MAETQANQIAPADYTPPDELQSNPYNYRISIEDIIYCIDILKLTHQQTADRLGCTHSNITQRLQKHNYVKGDLDDFKKHQADIYSIRRQIIAKKLTDEKLEKMSAYQLVGMDSMTLTNERLIRGESTENIAHIDMVRAQEIQDEKAQAFIDKYGSKVLETLDEP